jgi:DNA helicase II / ATP-dependent DNA helicase PcrA
MKTFLDDLNPTQKQAVLHVDKPLIIFAGAGTGKTRVITYRIAYLLSLGVPAYNIFAVTFTNKAAKEMKRRVTTLVPGMGDGVWLSTFHSFCAHFLRVEAEHIGLDHNFLIYDDSDQKKVLKDCIKELNLDDKKFRPGHILEIISRSKDDLLDADSYAIHAAASGDPFRETVGSIFSSYQKKLKQACALDFGDLILLTVIALRENELVREKYQDRVKYLLVDEYQDTNHAQYMLTKFLAGKHKNICVVGDDDQSIYSWRGADIRNILEFERDYPGSTMVKLEQNYRSTPQILSSAWQVISNNAKRVEKKLWTENGEGDQIVVLEHLNEVEEANNVAREIEKMVNEKRGTLCDFAVFYRTNAQSRVLEDAFRRMGISYSIVGTMRFYERSEVKDIIAYLRLIHNPNDNISFKRVVNVPRRGIGKQTIEVIEKYSVDKGISIWQSLSFLGSLGLPGAANRKLVEFKNLLENLRSLNPEHSVKEIANEVINKTGYIRELEEEESLESQNRIGNVQELISAIDEFERVSPDRSLTGYLTTVSLVTGLDSWADEEERVTLMTLHLAKGLEFKTAFITGLEEGLFPIGEAAFDPEDLAEERRLMYVGMTRAKEQLFLSWAAERKVYGKSRWNLPSRFIAEASKNGDIKVIDKSPQITNNRGEDRSTFVKTSVDKPLYDSRKRETPSDEAGCPPIYGDDYEIGSRVQHAQFGVGKIIERSGAGDDLKLIVLFNSGEWRKLLVKYANLQKV